MFFRIAHVTFGTSARIDFDYNDYTTAAAVEQAVLDLSGSRIGGNTELGSALQLTSNSLQRSSAGFRGANPIVVIVTDGQPTDSSVVTSAVAALTSQVILFFFLAVSCNVRETQICMDR